MTVSPLDANSSVWPAQAQAPRTPPPMTDTAKLLGSSASQLSQDLQSGDTLSSLASQQGLSSSSLITSIESDLKANANGPQGAPALSGSQLSQIATSIANGSTPSGTDQDHGAIFAGGPTSVRAQSNLSSLANTLGTDPTTLLAQLSSGQDLSSLLSASSDAGYGTPILNSNTGGIVVDQYA